MFQDFKLLEGKTVFENVAFTMEVLRRIQKHKKCAASVGIVGLDEMADRYPMACPGRATACSHCRAIINGPDILIYDEPQGIWIRNILWYYEIA